MMTGSRWRIYEDHAEAIRNEPVRNRSTCEMAFLEVFDELKARREDEAWLAAECADVFFCGDDGVVINWWDSGNEDGKEQVKAPTLHEAIEKARSK
jgi:hypothetical protein